MIIRKEIDFNKPLTEEQKKMLEALKTRPVEPDEDCPELTEDQLAKFAEAARERRNKKQECETVSISLSPQALLKAKSLGSGYTAVLSRIVEAALADNEIIKHYL